MGRVVGVFLHMRIFIISIVRLFRPDGLRSAPGIPSLQGSNMKSKAGGVPASYRLAVVSRVCAAVLGGYLLAALSSVCLTLLLPIPRVDAVLSGMMASFVFYLLAVLWCFACRTAWQAWFGLLLPSLVLALVAGSAYWVALP